MSVRVDAKHCLWFSWALPSVLGPEGEGSDSQPGHIDVDGASMVQIAQRDSSQKWRHHPSSDRESNANGLDGTDGTPLDVRGLENPGYQSAAYNSEGILPITTNLNKLVGIFEFGNAIPTSENPTSQLEIGAGPTELTVPEGATKLFLGFHDGREWTNNEKSIDFDVTVFRKG